MTSARPGYGGRPFRSPASASMPPAEAPTPTIGKRSVSLIKPFHPVDGSIPKNGADTSLTAARGYSSSLVRTGDSLNSRTEGKLPLVFIDPYIRVA